MVLGEKLENPYSVKNMKRAYANLAPATRSDVSDFEITTSHLYLKFKPLNEDELSILKQDSTLIMYEYPLDYDILEYGEYHDPEVPQGQPTYMYASVEVDKFDAIVSLGVDFEVLEDLFIPDEDSDFDEELDTRSMANKSWDFIDQLVDEALKITNNDEPLVAQTRASKWRPSGRIRYYCSYKNWTGLEGIKVKARRWFTTHTGLVDANGYYSCDGRFRRPANYSFYFERYEFEIRVGPEMTMGIDGPKRRGSWDLDIAEKTLHHFYATIFRAAYHYYYKDIKGLRRPPENSFWRTQMKLRGRYEVNNSVSGDHNSARRFLGMGSAIHIYNPQNKDYDIYATTIHELSHASHWRMIVKEPGTNRYRDYHYAEDKMTESWARGVQYYLTRMVYPKYIGGSTTTTYTNVVIDLIDTELDNPLNNGKSMTQGDRVEGYQMWQIESALIGSSSWNEWRNNIKNKYNNATEQHIDALFASW